MLGHSRIRRRAVPVAAAVLLACCLVAGPAQARASRPCHVQGTILEGDIVDLDTLTFAVHGNTEVDTFEHPIFFDGNLTGVGNAQERVVAHNQNGAFEVHDRVAFQGTATCTDGRVLGAGGLDINFVATGSFVTNQFTAHFEVIGSSGGLAGTTGSGTVSGVPGVPGGNGPYDATLH
jgi:hypothetical protein